MGFLSRLFGRGSEDERSGKESAPSARKDEISGSSRIVQENGVRVLLDLTTQKLAFSVPESYEDPGAVPLRPALEVPADGFVSGAALVQKAKQVDDGIFAALELAAQDGTGARPGKRRLLEALGKRHLEDDAGEELASFFAAAQAGGLSLELRAGLADAVREALQEFQRDENASKPLGFYTWSEELTAIFRQDRLLQTELPSHRAIESLARALSKDRELGKAYVAELQSAERLTNPWPEEHHDLREWVRALGEGGALDDLPTRNVRFLPPSQSPEGELMKKLFGGRSIPEGFDLADEIIDRLRQGTLSLEPRSSSGYYARQLWALEPILLLDRMPEATRFTRDDELRRYHRELFKLAMALSRETHVKQLEMAACGAAPPSDEPRKVVRIAPLASCEPLVSYYKRRADSYAFLRGMVEESFGSEALRSTRTLSPEGRTDRTVGDELEALESVFRGAAVVALRELGEPLERHLKNVGREEAWSKAFRSFALGQGGDADLSRDSRMMVPVFYDLERKKVKAWVFLGWRQMSLELSFAQAPGISVQDAEGRDLTGQVEVELESAWKSFFVPVVREIYVSRLLDRDELRKLCDKKKSERAILEALA